MIKINNNSNQLGLSLISLTITVIVLVIITSTLIYNAKNGIKMRALNLMENDIEMLDDKINAYYVRYGALPIDIKYIGDIYFTPQANDGPDYYVIDLKALEGVTLNYGAEFNNINNENDTIENIDVYIINENSHQIYYAKGIQMDGVWYYTTTKSDLISMKINSTLEMREFGEKGYQFTLTTINKGQEYSYKIYINDTEDGSTRVLKQGTTTESVITTEEFETFFDIGIRDAYAEITYNYNGVDTTIETDHFTKTDMQIKYKEELEYFRNKVNSGKTYDGQTITQISDIDLQGSASNPWTPIGTSDTVVFKGTYEGKNHQIKNLYINSTLNYQGLFGSNAGTIKKLIIENGSVTTTLGKVAGISGYNTGKIIGCINKANVSSTVGYVEEGGCLRSDCGGIVGFNSYNGTVENCANFGNIFGNGKLIGGISGFTNGGSIIKCYNSGSITSNAQQIGGITGDLDGEKTDYTVTMESCYNVGVVTCQNSNIDAIKREDATYCGVGGLVGCLYINTEIKNCYNAGNVTLKINTNLEDYFNNNYGSITGSKHGNENKITNTFYLDITCDRGQYDYINGNTSNNGIKTSAELKNLATTLGTNFKDDINNINKGYPILIWQ